MDIDIDFGDRTEVLKFLKHIPATTIQNNQLTKHICGVYFQDIPTDPETGFASIPADIAEKRNWFKIDCLNVSLYKEIENEEHLNRLLNKEPLWDLLQSKDFVEGQQLFHLHDHFELLQKMRPASIEQLAMVLALRLPSKHYLVGKTWEEIEKEIWEPVDKKATAPMNYAFKKSHAISYALAVIVHMNLIIEKIMKD